ncbi:hypothetical protein ACFL60_01150 [Candidatus Omnitrophota bacterium]
MQASDRYTRRDVSIGYLTLNPNKGTEYPIIITKNSMHFKAFLSKGSHLSITIFFKHKNCLFESAEKAIIHVQNVIKNLKTYKNPQG